MKQLHMLLAVVIAACSTSPQMPTVSEYDRASWGRWIDEDGDCQDTRQEVLIRESQVEATLDEKGCKVLTGRWLCPYTGNVITDPGLLDVDHVVPLKEAHDSGAHSWSAEEKKLYFNYLGKGHLHAVSRSANRSKGSRAPDEWMPPNQDFRCQYAKDWLKAKYKWELDYDPEEADELVRIIGGCL